MAISQPPRLGNIQLKVKPVTDPSRRSIYSVRFNFTDSVSRCWATEWRRDQCISPL